MGDVKKIRDARPICCALCDGDDWKVYVDWEEQLMAEIVKVRCSNCKYTISVRRGEKNT